nr:PREDICTED: histone deacetylase complex subunit SAP30L [Bos mutus]
MENRPYKRPHSRAEPAAPLAAAWKPRRAFSPHHHVPLSEEQRCDVLASQSPEAAKVDRGSSSSQPYTRAENPRCPPHKPHRVTVPLRLRPRLYFCPPKVILCPRSRVLRPAGTTLTIPPRARKVCGPSCCLIEDGERCVRPAGNASFSKRVQKSISQKKLKLDIDKSVRHLYICDFHKNFIQSVRNKRKRKTSDDGGDSPEHDTDIPEVDLFQLQVNTLRRYKRHYKLQTRPGFNKAQLAETVSRHFRNIPVNEKETLAYFIYMVKSNKSRLDQKSESGKQLE